MIFYGQQVLIFEISIENGVETCTIGDFQRGHLIFDLLRSKYSHIRNQRESGVVTCIDVHDPLGHQIKLFGYAIQPQGLFIKFNHKDYLLSLGWNQYSLPLV